MKPHKQLQTEALARREKNVAQYNGGNLGSLKLPEGADKAEYLAKKLGQAEKDVGVLKAKLGIRE